MAVARRGVPAERSAVRAGLLPAAAHLPAATPVPVLTSCCPVASPSPTGLERSPPRLANSPPGPRPRRAPSRMRAAGQIGSPSGQTPCSLSPPSPPDTVPLCTRRAMLERPGGWGRPRVTAWAPAPAWRAPGRRGRLTGGLRGRAAGEKRAGLMNAGGARSTGHRRRRRGLRSRGAGSPTPPGTNCHADLCSALSGESGAGCGRGSLSQAPAMHTDTPTSHPHPCPHPSSEPKPSLHKTCDERRGTL